MPERSARCRLAQGPQRPRTWAACTRSGPSSADPAGGRQEQDEDEDARREGRARRRRRSGKEGAAEEDDQDEDDGADKLGDAGKQASTA